MSTPNPSKVCELLLQYGDKMNLATMVFFFSRSNGFCQPNTIDTAMSMALKLISKAETAGHLWAYSVL